MDGMGIFRYVTGDMYAGHFSQNKKHGFGVYIFAGGAAAYSGEWHTQPTCHACRTCQT